MNTPLFRFKSLYGGPPYLVDEVNPDAVISLASRIVARSKNTRYIYNYPIRNLHVEPIRNIGYALEKIDYHINRNDIIYVHCLGGCGRTSTVISAYLILFHRYSYREAILEFLHQRGCTIESYEQDFFLKVLNRLVETKLNMDKIITIIKNSNTLDDFISNIEKYSG